MRASMVVVMLAGLASCAGTFSDHYEAQMRKQNSAAMVQDAEARAAASREKALKDAQTATQKTGAGATK